jgi:hypothetical protein
MAEGSLEETEIVCPFCGEEISILIDCSQDRQTYVEDCSVCCRPIQVAVSCEDGRIESVTAGRS